MVPLRQGQGLADLHGGGVRALKVRAGGVACGVSVPEPHLGVCINQPSNPDALIIRFGELEDQKACAD